MGKAKRGRPLKQKPEALGTTYVVEQDPPEGGKDSEHEELDEVLEREIEEEVRAAAAAKEAKEKAEEKNSDSESDESNVVSLSDSEEMESPAKPQPKKLIKSKKNASPKKLKPEPPPKKTKQSSEDKDLKVTKANLAKVMKAKGKDQKVQPTKGAKSLKEVGTKKEALFKLILEGLSQLDEKKGVTLPALKKYLIEGDEAKIKNWDKMKPRIREALDKGMGDNLIVRPKGYENMTGLTGTFKINKKEYMKLDTVKPKSENVTASNASKSKLNPKTAKPPKIPKANSEDANSKKSKKRPLPSHRRSKSGEPLIERGKGKLKKSQSLEHLSQPSKKTKSKK